MSNLGTQQRIFPTKRRTLLCFQSMERPINKKPTPLIRKSTIELGERKDPIIFIQGILWQGKDNLLR